MFDDVKIYTSSNKNLVENFIVEWWDKWYYKTDFRTDIIYTSFQFAWAHEIYYTVVMARYKDEPILLDDNSNTNATEIWGEGELSTTTEQVHSEKWGRSKKGKNSEKEVSTTSDSSSVHES